ncbi:hypothetical protein [Natrinema pallidum]|uniref:Tail terminator n=1 Tax=Natrinema pallidum TaxID=69527 RepID=A0A4P9TFS5_9EURY|nr:hypothetical protein [Natrinema pallidum]QCW03569.1 hypothetical protein FGF80_10095 [Natrinema pallidum]
MTRKRADDLLVDIVGWLENDSTIQNRLGTDGEVVTYGQAEELPALAIAVTVIPGASDRDNLREDKTMIVEVEISASNSWVESNTTLELEQLAGDVDDALTQHRDGWTANGQSGGTGSISPDTNRPRYSGVRRYDFGRNDPGSAHD